MPLDRLTMVAATKSGKNDAPSAAREADDQADKPEDEVMILSKDGQEGTAEEAEEEESEKKQTPKRKPEGEPGKKTGNKIVLKLPPGKPKPDDAIGKKARQLEREMQSRGGGGGRANPQNNPSLFFRSQLLPAPWCSHQEEEAAWALTAVQPIPWQRQQQGQTR